MKLNTKHYIIAARLFLVLSLILVLGAVILRSSKQPNVAASSSPSKPFILEYSEHALATLNRPNSPADTYGALLRLVSLERGRTFCSATVVSHTLAITAAHCLVDETGLMVTTIFGAIGEDIFGSKSRPVEVRAVAAHVGADYAIIQGDFSGFSTVKVLDRPQSVLLLFDAPLLACGYPYNSTATCYPVGKPIVPFLGQLRSGGLMFPGMSGGPVIDISTNTLTAVNSRIGDGFVVISPVVGIFDNLDVTLDK